MFKKSTAWCCLFLDIPEVPEPGCWSTFLLGTLLFLFILEFENRIFSHFKFKVKHKKEGTESVPSYCQGFFPWVWILESLERPVPDHHGPTGGLLGVSKRRRPRIGPTQGLWYWSVAKNDADGEKAAKGCRLEKGCWPGKKLLVGNRLLADATSPIDR